MSASLLVLALSAFAIGTTEFVIMGLLPEVATDLDVSIPAAGWLITAYALGVALGAPFMTLLMARLPRREALLALMLIFIAGNAIAAVSGAYGQLMVARVVTSLCHGAFFGIGAVFASDIAPPSRRASAVALMFSGLTLANVLGVPLGTVIGQAFGWRWTFWGVTGLGVMALAGMWRYLPRDEHHASAPDFALLDAFRDGGLWLALATTAMFSAAMFALFSYIAPILRELTGVSPQGVSWTLMLIGIGLTLGNFVGGRLGDRHLLGTLCGAFGAVAVCCIMFVFASAHLIAAEVTLFVWAVATFALVPALQINVVNRGQRAPSLISTLNIGAFNIGNALGAWIGGTVIASGLGLRSVPIAAACLAIAGLMLAYTNRSRTPGE